MTGEWSESSLCEVHMLSGKAKGKYDQLIINSRIEYHFIDQQSWEVKATAFLRFTLSEQMRFTL